MLAAHAARPGLTARGFERGGSYDRLAASIAAGARVLDLGCGDGALLRRIPGSVGIDLSPHELARTRNAVRARAQALPFRDRSFEVVTCHLAFMLFDAIDDVVAEIDRVLVPGGSLLAVLGGGPVAEPAPDDAFPIFLELVGRQGVLAGDRRARSEAGWRSLFPGWEVPAWQRDELVLDGCLDDVWSFFEASYELPDDASAARGALAARVREPVRCRAVTWLARATKP